ncbi:MAG: XdhC family protein [Paracoccaceae bacterium]
MPRVLIFGAGHVGRALARALAPLPVAARLIDSRAEQLALVDCPDKCLSALPGSEVRSAPPGTAYVIATHDHALDFLLVGEALRRSDAAYVGMIGSSTKRAKFYAWARRSEPRVDPEGLVCPIGQAGLGDKRPEVIAAFVATELLSVFATQSIPERMENPA